MKTYVLLRSQKGNTYVHDIKMKKTLPCHPVLHFIIKEIDQGRDVTHLFEQADNESIEIEDFGFVSKAEVLYYYRKYLMLEENGYFEEINPKDTLSPRLTPKDVKRSLANCHIVTFETTDKCNLSCMYCGYGRFYSNYDQRNNKNLDIEAAKQMLLYLRELWNSPLNISHDRTIYIGFYGGEPLLNFPFVEEVIRFSRNLSMQHNRFRFSMTTNALMLKKYMDFLAKNDFSLLISLDGNEKNNQYRSTLSGEPSFPVIIKNIRALQTRYPDYFKRSVNFNAVVHNKNSVAEIFKFFKDHFNKYPSISPLNTTGIDADHKEEFRKTYANIEDSLYKSEDYSLIEKEMFINLPNIQTLTTFLHHKTDLSFKDYNELLYSRDNIDRFPTGTCTPFSKKIFVTVNGKILVCERIGQEHVVGHVTSQAVHIDYESIANTYNRYFDKMISRCRVCYNWDSCSQCIFHLPLDEESPSCGGFMNRETYSRYVSSIVSHIENKPGLYEKIFKEVWVE